MSERKSEEGGVPKWFMQPASWLSIISAIVAVGTFILVQAYPGRLETYLPDRVGLAMNETGGLRLLIPFTFTNTGAERTHRHVTRIRALFHPLSNGTDIDLAWTMEYKFISGPEYKKKNPEDKNPPEFEDYTEYVNRAVPFHLAGKSSVVHVYALDQTNGPAGGNALTTPFKLTVHIYTESGRYTRSMAYYAPKPARGYRWADAQ